MLGSKRVFRYEDFIDFDKSVEIAERANNVLNGLLDRFPKPCRHPYGRVIQKNDEAPVCTDCGNQFLPKVNL